MPVSLQGTRRHTQRKPISLRQTVCMDPFGKQLSAHTDDITSKVSGLNHIFEAVDIQPVTDRIQYPDRILSLQKFLKQLRNTGLSILWLGEYVQEEIVDLTGCGGRELEKSHPDPVNRFRWNTISQFFEVDLHIKGFPRIRKRALSKTTQTGITDLALPVAVDKNHAFILFLAQRLRDILIEQHVTVRNDRRLETPRPGLQGQ